MKKNFIIFGLALLSLGACKSHLNISNVHTEKNISINSTLQEDPNIKAVIAPYKKELDGKMNTKISYTPVDLTKTGDNPNLGNLLADYTYDGAQEWAKNNNIPNIDAAVINIGGIRSTIGAGDILTKHVFEVMPFENEIVIVKLKGSELKGLFQYYLENKTNNPVSHLTIETSGNILKTELINGKQVDPNKDYYIATSDYLALGGDRMYFFTKGQMISTNIKMRDLFLQKIKNTPEIKAPNDIRLTFK